MRSKTPLALMEQMVMVLIFSLAAAVCVQAFVLADRMSKDRAAADQAILQAESAAELVKYCHGDLREAAEMLGGSADEAAWELWLDANGEPVEKDGRTEVVIQTLNSENPRLGRAEVRVRKADQTQILVFETAWQQ